MALKIARLVEERGWNQEDFARIAHLNRHTVRRILKGGAGHRLRNATVSQCAAALGLQVNELRDLPLERLLPRMHGKQMPADQVAQIALRERATMPQLLAWLASNPERAAQLSLSEVEELLSMQGPDGPLARFGVDHCVDRIERKRRLLRRAAVIAGTPYIDLLEQFVNLMFEKVQTPPT